MSWVDDFTAVVGGVSGVLTQVNELTGQDSPGVVPKQAAEETAKVATVEGANTLPASTSPWLLVGLAVVAVVLLSELK